MTSYTPGRVSALKTGYYADPSSPIASTPQRKTTVSTRPVAASTPSAAALSPMRVSEKPLQRHDAPPADGEGKTWGIFSPVLKFFGSDDEKAAAGATGAVGGSGAMVGGGGAGAMPTASSSSSSAVPTLSPAPAGRTAVAATGKAAVTTASAAYLASSSTSAHTPSTPSSAGGGAYGYGPSGTVSATPGKVGVSAGSTSAVAGRTDSRLITSVTQTPPTPASAAAHAAASASAAAAVARSTAAATAAATSKAGAPAPAPAPTPAITASSYTGGVPAPSGTSGAAASAEDEDDAEYDEYEAFNPYLFIKLLPPYASVAPRVPRILLPKKPSAGPGVSLVLDLDETLVHCSVDPIPDADVTFPVAFGGQNYQVYVRKRPHLDTFLNWIAGRFEVTIFTASQQVYAERLLNLLDPEGKCFNHRLYRDSCLNVNGNYLKDLNVLGRDMSKTVLVDNSPHAFGYQVDNGIPIESWFDDRGDRELLKLKEFLAELLYAPDVRPVVRDKFKLHRLIAEASSKYSAYY